MQRSDVLGDINQKFRGDIIDFIDKSPTRVYIEIKPSSLIKIAEHIFKNLKARFSIASGVDARSHMEILYHFTFDDINLVISLT